MPRNRMIKSEYWTSEQVLSCSIHARLLFIGLWNFSDDNGIHQASYLRLKAEVFPADNFTIEEIKQWIDELIYHGLLREYIAHEKSYWIVTGWKEHQKIDKPTTRHPLPLPNLIKVNDQNPIALEDNSAIARRIITEESTTNHRRVATKVKERKEKIKKINICEVKTSHADSEENPVNSIQEIFEYWQEALKHPRAKLDKKRQSIIKQALNLGYSTNELKQAIDGCANTPYNMGKNNSNQIFDEIGLILRDSAHIERFINNSHIKNAINNDMGCNDFMAGVI
ncbi:TPA: hypothetical protein ACT9AU_001894 [Legionella pneumophila]|nr:hypothetical protein [Legionella pneumophila]HAU0941417.1 hypothetical protein [Legionella pneumophila]HDO7873628.1 hypothetical protein [Legionella pneumophila]HDO7940527.1 hypothetical protein [Legionella pneumophila]HDO8157871.1 hypothetical protein [Legionella pneumophila]